MVVLDDYLFKLSLYCENLELVFDTTDYLLAISPLALLDVLLVEP